MWYFEIVKHNQDQTFTCTTHTACMLWFCFGKISVYCGKGNSIIWCVWSDIGT